MRIKQLLETLLLPKLCDVLFNLIFTCFLIKLNQPKKFWQKATIFYQNCQSMFWCPNFFCYFDIRVKVKAATATFEVKTSIGILSLLLGSLTLNNSDEDLVGGGLSSFSSSLEFFSAWRYSAWQLSVCCQGSSTSLSLYASMAQSEKCARLSLRHFSDKAKNREVHFWKELSNWSGF